MTSYYALKNDKIVGVSSDKNKLIRSIGTDVEIQETERPLVLSEDGTYYVFADTDEYLQEQAEKRKEEFNKEFFLTSLGYIRRKVNMATGETRDFLFDLLPAIEKSVSIGQPYPVIVYKQPDFTKEITTEYLVSLQEFKNATEQFCKECTLQIGTDFSGVPMTLDDL